mgnify:FL=1
MIDINSDTKMCGMKVFSLCHGTRIMIGGQQLIHFLHRCHCSRSKIHFLSAFFEGCLHVLNYVIFDYSNLFFLLIFLSFFLKEKKGTIAKPQKDMYVTILPE